MARLSLSSSSVGTSCLVRSVRFSSPPRCPDASCSPPDFARSAAASSVRSFDRSRDRLIPLTIGSTRRGAPSLGMRSPPCSACSIISRRTSTRSRGRGRIFEIASLGLEQGGLIAFFLSLELGSCHGVHVVDLRKLGTPNQYSLELRSIFALAACIAALKPPPSRAASSRVIVPFAKPLTSTSSASRATALHSL